MSNEEQRKRVLAWAHEVLANPKDYTKHHYQRAVVLLAQEAELAANRASSRAFCELSVELKQARELLQRSDDQLRDWATAFPDATNEHEYKLLRDLRAHLDGPKKAGWSEVLGILADGSGAPSLGPPRLYRENAQLRQRVVELEAECERIRKQRNDQLKACILERAVSEERFAEITRLREALEVILGASCGATIDIPAKGFEWAHNIAHQALYGAKGAKDEAEHTTDTSDDSSRDISHGSGVATPLSEPLELHYQMSVIEWRDALRKRNAEIVAAIAKMQEQINSLAARCRLLENEDQNQHDSLVDHGHAIDQHREQIGTLEKRIDFHAVNNPLNGNPDDISLHELISVVDQRCDLIEQVLGGMTEKATFEQIDALTEAVKQLGGSI